MRSSDVVRRIVSRRMPALCLVGAPSAGGEALLQWALVLRARRTWASFDVLVVLGSVV